MFVTLNEFSHIVTGDAVRFLRQPIGRPIEIAEVACFARRRLNFDEK
jgi:hypothetical protein